MTVGSGLYSHRRLMSVSSAILGSSSTLRALALFLSLLSSRRTLQSSSSTCDGLVTRYQPSPWLAEPEDADTPAGWAGSGHFSQSPAGTGLFTRGV